MTWSARSRADLPFTRYRVSVSRIAVDGMWKKNEWRSLQMQEECPHFGLYGGGFGFRNCDVTAQRPWKPGF
jgi:hypothetical protein